MRRCHIYFFHSAKANCAYQFGQTLDAFCTRTERKQSYGTHTSTVHMYAFLSLTVKKTQVHFGKTRVRPNVHGRWSVSVYTKTQRLSKLTPWSVCFNFKTRALWAKLECQTTTSTVFRPHFGQAPDIAEHAGQFRMSLTHTCISTVVIVYCRIAKLTRITASLAQSVTRRAIDYKGAGSNLGRSPFFFGGDWGLPLRRCHIWGGIGGSH